MSGTRGRGAGATHGAKGPAVGAHGQRWDAIALNLLLDRTKVDLIEDIGVHEIAARLCGGWWSCPTMTASYMMRACLVRV